MEKEEFINLVFSFYKLNRENGKFTDINVPKNIINMYFEFDYKLDFNMIFSRFKEKYIIGESKIDNTTTREEQLGLGEVYDYIASFDFNSQKFDIFVQSLIIH